jgi:hypothetical protein
MKTHDQPPLARRGTSQRHRLVNFATVEPDGPPATGYEPEEPSDLDDFDLPWLPDDSRWDVFVPEDDERDPLPEPGDFWNDEFPDDE